MYTAFAEIYDELMADVDYASWAAFYEEILSAYGIAPGAKVCECACGTGSLTLPLRQAGYVMTGVDLSQDMLWVASQKARAAGAAIPFICQDMRSLRLHRPMDAVLATCDGVNYLLESRDVERFFRAAWDALRPGGALVFDVSTPDKLEHALGDRTFFEETERVSYVWQNTYHPKNATVDMSLSFFVREDSGLYRRIDERQTQKAHARETLTELLQLCGYKGIRVMGDHRIAEPTPHEQRWHIAALKPMPEQEG